MKEKAILFGKSARLVGVVTIPARDTAKQDAPALIVLNSGLLHRVGAGRLSVRVIRALAEEGYHGLRFDFSGLGDSDNRTDGMPFEERCAAEAREAMDYVTDKYGIGRFVLMGLCSGADIAFETAVADSRTVGLIQIDPFSYRTPKFYLHYTSYLLQQHGPKLFRPTEWWRVANKFGGPMVRKLLGKQTLAERYPNLIESPFQREIPPKTYVAAGLRELVSRGTRILNVFTGGMKDQYNHQSQYFDCFRDIDFAGRLTTRYLPDADHTLEALDLQERFIADLRSWFQTLPLTPAPGTVTDSEERKTWWQRLHDARYAARRASLSILGNDFTDSRPAAKPPEGFTAKT
jgi:pimeloyl-ACP methyl ester carboxylesterase